MITVNRTITITGYLDDEGRPVCGDTLGTACDRYDICDDRTWPGTGNCWTPHATGCPVWPVGWENPQEKRCHARGTMKDPCPRPGIACGKCPDWYAGEGPR